MVFAMRPALAGIVVSCLLGASLAAAQEVKGKGHVVYVPHSTETFKLADGTPAMRMQSKGVVLAADPATSIHLSTQDCSGTYVMNVDGTMRTASGYCDGIDKDGHVWWIWWKGNQAGSNWGFLGGTGKYEGIKGGGTTKTEMQAADGRLVISWEGNWTTTK